MINNVILQTCGICEEDIKCSKCIEVKTNKIIELRQRLKSIEWGLDDVCPACGADNMLIGAQHDQECWLAAEIEGTVVPRESGGSVRHATLSDLQRRVTALENASRK